MGFYLNVPEPGAVVLSLNMFNITNSELNSNMILAYSFSYISFEYNVGFQNGNTAIWLSLHGSNTQSL